MIPIELSPNKKKTLFKEYYIFITHSIDREDLVFNAIKEKTIKRSKINLPEEDLSIASSKTTVVLKEKRSDVQKRELYNLLRTKDEESHRHNFYSILHTEKNNKMIAERERHKHQKLDEKLYINHCSYFSNF